MDNFSDPEQADRYGKQMWNFVRKATGQVDDLVDDVNHAETTFNDVVKYYGEDERNMSSSEFYGIFKTFVTSYKVLKLLFYRLNSMILTYGSVEMQGGQSGSLRREAGCRETQASG